MAIDLSDMNVAQIAALLGFCDAGYFTNFFYAKADMTPSYYRKWEWEQKWSHLKYWKN